MGPTRKMPNRRSVQSVASLKSHCWLFTPRSMNPSADGVKGCMHICMYACAVAYAS